MNTLSTILVALIAGFVGAVLKLGQDSWTRINDSRALAATLAADIAATLSIANQRHYVEIAEQQLKKLENGDDVFFVDFMHNAEQLNAVFNSAIQNSKLGLIGPENASVVTRFFRQLNAIIGDIKKADEINKWSKELKTRYMTEMLVISRETVRDGEIAVSKLTKFSQQANLTHLWNGIHAICSERDNRPLHQ
jgi:hypothetical protein